MNKEIKEIMRLFLKMLVMDKCPCGYESIHYDCPVHGHFNSTYKELVKKLKEK